MDPVNEFDLTGEFSVRNFLEGQAKQYLSDWVAYSPTGAIGVYYNYRRLQAMGPKAYALDTGRAAITYLPAGKILASGAKGGVYVARTTSRQLYVGQTNNFAVRGAQHARSGKIAANSKRLQIPITSKPARNKVERIIYNYTGWQKISNVSQ